MCRSIPVLVYTLKIGKNGSLCLHLFLRIMFSITKIFIRAKNVPNKNYR